jgi:predicted nucleic acid-binding protein
LSRVFWDTNLFIYLLEDLEGFGQRVAEIRTRMTERNDQLYTSALTLGEVLVKPIEDHDEELRRKYLSAITERCIVLPFNSQVAPTYARIRTDRTIRAPDAIQLAVAAQAGIDLFITNDERLSTRTIDGIQFITSLERAFL